MSTEQGAKNMNTWDVEAGYIEHGGVLPKATQGANMNTFTKENTKEATHVIFYHNLSKVAFAKKDSNEIFHDDEEEWRESGFMWEKSGRAFIELSRPAGERKEDHTNDGVLTKAQPQGQKAYEVALMIEALDDNPDEHKEAAKSDRLNKHIELQVEEVGITSDLDVVISPEPTSVDSGFNASAYEESCKRFEDEDKPVFTQEQADAGIIPPVGMRAMFYVEEKDVNAWFPGLVCGEFMGKAVARLDDSEVQGCFDDYSADQCKPIDNRSDTDKLMDYIGCCVEEWKDDCIDLDEAVSSLITNRNFTITLNKG